MRKFVGGIVLLDYFVCWRDCITGLFIAIEEGPRDTQGHESLRAIVSHPWVMGYGLFCDGKVAILSNGIFPGKVSEQF